MRIPDLKINASGDEKSLELIAMLLTHSARPFDRAQYCPGHLTATGLVLHPDGKSIAMVHHARLDRWLLPGGHVEASDESVEAAAAREVLEETGLQVVDPGRIIGGDVHGIPAKWKEGVEIEPYHLHHDVLVSFRAAATTLVVSEESFAVRWVAPVDFDLLGVPLNVRRGYARVLAAQ
ncbi:NUDIX hydrolase [Bryobacter aggregatus]|uniref:NUDIX hydrolase n=1 Tax=Bryobacter aggregatus TaxID=360054 RepID=UPI00069036D4|nr:NUDIX domain-containing protein [Bryobacter aggregatus]